MLQNEKTHKAIVKLLDLKPIPLYAGHITLRSFVMFVQNGNFNKSSDTNYYATEYGMSDKIAHIEDIESGRIDWNWTYIALM